MYISVYVHTHTHIYLYITVYLLNIYIFIYIQRQTKIFPSNMYKHTVEHYDCNDAKRNKNKRKKYPQLEKEASLALIYRCT